MQEYGQNASASGHGWGRGRRHPTQRDNDAQDTHGRTTDRMRVSSNLKSTSSATVSPRQYALNLPPTAATTPLLARWRRTRSASRVRGEERRSGCAHPHTMSGTNLARPPPACARDVTLLPVARRRAFIPAARSPPAADGGGDSLAHEPRRGGGGYGVDPCLPPPPHEARQDDTPAWRPRDKRTTCTRRHDVRARSHRRPRPVVAATVSGAGPPDGARSLAAAAAHNGGGTRRRGAHSGCTRQRRCWYTRVSHGRGSPRAAADGAAAAGGWAVTAAGGTTDRRPLGQAMVTATAPAARCQPGQRRQRLDEPRRLLPARLGRPRQPTASGSQARPRLAISAAAARDAADGAVEAGACTGGQRRWRQRRARGRRSAGGRRRDPRPRPDARRGGGT